MAKAKELPGRVKGFIWQGIIEHNKGTSPEKLLELLNDAAKKQNYTEGFTAEYVTRKLAEPGGLKANKSAIIKRPTAKAVVNGSAADLVKSLEALVSSHGAEKCRTVIEFLEKF